MICSQWIFTKHNNLRKRTQAAVSRFFGGAAELSADRYTEGNTERNALLIFGRAFVLFLAGSGRMPLLNKNGRFAGFYAMIRKNPPAPAGGGSQKDRKAAHVPNSKSIES